MSFEKNYLYYKETILSYVPLFFHRVLLGSNLKTPELVKIKLRETRRPELGNKFSSRHGQKGICGMIILQEDRPFNEQD